MQRKFWLFYIVSFGCWKITFGAKKGFKINAFMSATAWNLKKMMEILSEKVKRLFRTVFFR
jgi:hypothetical protein